MIGLNVDCMLYDVANIKNITYFIVNLLSLRITPHTILPLNILHFKALCKRFTNCSIKIKKTAFAVNFFELLVC